MSSIIPANDFPEGEYDVVLADPPWSYWGNQDCWGSASKQYPTMPDEELLALPIRRLMAKRSILFLWATAPRLGFAFKCIEAWGLHDRGAQFVWIKTRKDGVPIGAQGVRPSIVKPTCEFVIAASTVARGRPLPLATESIRHTILAAKMEHSRKPDDVHRAIEAMYPKSRKIELFARRPYPNWTVWGNEVEAANDNEVAQ
ncbi:MAG TPA: MT-A70 family methyltransferase [Caulobacteraceae bacterium]|jgi:N6-adenosine-specific RNA methylase IME4|nr:MT-A70 family methyltransferase [Caulobacteraceae bacterium]